MTDECALEQLPRERWTWLSYRWRTAYCRSQWMELFHVCHGACLMIGEPEVAEDLKTLRDVALIRSKEL